MKKLFITALVAIASSTSLFAQTTEAAQQITATQQIIDKHIEAIGGAENWRKINTIIAKATTKAQGAEIKITTSQIHKKAFRLDIDVMGMNGYQILTTTNGWAFMPFAGQTKPEPMTEDDVKSSQDQLDVVDEFIGYKEAGKKLEDLGKDEIDGTECYKLKMYNPNGKTTTFFIDATTNLVLKQETQQTVNGKEVNSTSEFSNYKKLDSGIVFPMSMTNEMGLMEFSEININVPIDEKIFEVKK